MKPLVILAHGDDETLGCGGLLAKYGGTVILLSSCFVDCRGIPQDNASDAIEACKILGVELIMLELPDQMFEMKMISHTINKVLDLTLPEYDTVITHSPNDLNNDHKYTYKVASVVARPKNKPVSLLHCEIPSNSMWGLGFHPNFFVEINIAQKLTALRCYKSESFNYPHPDSIPSVLRLAKYRGQQSGYKYAEGYFCERWCI